MTGLFAQFHNRNLVLNRYLHKGVLAHSFLDQSGCVFLDLYSGETLSVLVSEAEILKVLSGKNLTGKKKSCEVIVKSLIQKNILIPLDSKNTDV